jgi:hypothetical protein
MDTRNFPDDVALATSRTAARRNNRVPNDRRADPRRGGARGNLGLRGSTKVRLPQMTSDKQIPNLVGPQPARAISRIEGRFGQSLRLGSTDFIGDQYGRHDRIHHRRSRRCRNRYLAFG